MQKVLTDVAQGAYRLAIQIVKQSADAQDILQEAAAIAISHKEAPRYDSSDFKPWFYRVVRNKSIDRFRELNRQAVNDSYQAATSNNASCSSNPEQQLQNEQLRQQLDTALENLPVQQRDMILLKDYHHMSYADIAHILNVPQGTVMSSLHRARMALRNSLQNREER